MSEAGKSQEPSMEEILASIRRIIAEDEAGRSRPAPAPMPQRPAEPSRTPRPRVAAEAPALHAPPSGEAGEMVLDLTNMVAADGSVVTIAPDGRAAPPQGQPQGFAPGVEQQTVAYSGFSRRAPPPGPGAEPHAPSFTPAPVAPAPFASPPPLQPAGFASTDTPSRRARAQESTLAPLPPTLSEDSPSRRVFKRRHTAGSAFAELAQSGYAPQPQDANGNFGQVPVGSVATELDMSAQTPPPPPVYAAPAAPQAFAPQDPYVPAAFAPQPAPMPPAAMAPPPMPMAPVPPPIPPALSDDQMRAAVGAAAEPVIRSWLDANLAGMIEQQLATLVQQRVDQSVAATLPQAVDQRIHQNVETNLGPYIEDRVGAHVDARLAAAVEEKVTAAVKQQVASAVNQQIAQSVSQQVTAAVTQQLQSQTQNVSRLVDDRVKSEIRSLFQRLAGN